MALCSSLRLAGAMNLCPESASVSWSGQAEALRRVAE